MSPYDTREILFPIGYSCDSDGIIYDTEDCRVTFCIGEEVVFRTVGRTIAHTIKLGKACLIVDEGMVRYGILSKIRAKTVVVDVDGNPRVLKHLTFVKQNAIVLYETERLRYYIDLDRHPYMRANY